MVVVAVMLTGSNVIGFTKCSKQASKQIRDMASSAITSGLTVSNPLFTLPPPPTPRTALWRPGPPLTRQIPSNEPLCSNESLKIPDMCTCFGKHFREVHQYCISWRRGVTRRTGVRASSGQHTRALWANGVSCSQISPELYLQQQC